MSFSIPLRLELGASVGFCSQFFLLVQYLLFLSFGAGSGVLRVLLSCVAAWGGGGVVLILCTVSAAFHPPTPPFFSLFVSSEAVVVEVVRSTAAFFLFVVLLDTVVGWELGDL